MKQSMDVNIYAPTPWVVLSSEELLETTYA